MLSFTSLAVDLTEANSYAADRGWTDWTGTDQVKTAALRRGQDAIAGEYNGRWLDDDWDDDSAPDNVRFAIIEAARRELIEPGAMTPDMERGGEIKSLRAGSVAIEYKDGAPSETTFKSIANLLAGLIAPDTGPAMFGAAGRT